MLGKIDIVRVGGADDSIIEINVYDNASRITFVRIKIKPEDLMLALSGLASRPMSFETRNLDVVGKTKIVKDFIVNVSSDDKREYALGYNKPNVKFYINTVVIDMLGDDWLLDSSIEFKNAVVNNDDGSMTLNLKKYKYV